MNAVHAAISRPKGTSMPPTVSDEHAARIDALFGALTPEGPGYAVGVVQRGETVFTGAWGAADLEHGVPITPASRFYLGSISKQFVAMAALMLAAEQGVDLAQPIGDTFPELSPPTAEATLYQLLTHTSGIRDFYALGGLAGHDAETVYTEHLALKMLARQQCLNFPAGSDWLYSNSGYLLLALFVHRVSGQRLDEFARTRIFAPLGMDGARFQHDHAALVPNKAHGYQRRAGAWRTFDSMVDVVGGGGMYASVDDMLAWLRNLDAPQVGAVELAAMRRPAILASSAEVALYGMGFQLGSLAGRPTVAHGGGLAGYRTQLIWIPDERLSVVVLGNSASATPGPLARKIASIVLGVEDAPSAPPPAYPASPAELEGRAGLYRLATGGYLELSMRNDALTVAGLRLTPVGPGVFRVGPGADGVTIVFDGDSGSWAAPDAPPTSFERCDPQPLGPEDQRAYVGAYESPELRATYRIAERGEGLAVEMGERPPLTLRPTGRPDELLIGRTGLVAAFQRDPGGAVAGLTVDAIRAKGLAFRRL